MMNAPLVSIGMKVWNGETFLREAIESLLGQDYENIELVILDNLSTDATAEICQEYVRKDPRVRYLLATERESVIEADRRLAQLVRGDFFMSANDDDVYDPKYISTLAPLLWRDPEVALAYSAIGHIQPDGIKITEGLGGPALRTNRHTRAANFMHHLLWRTSVPMAFGVIRTALHRKALRYYERVDQHSRWEHDVLWLLRMLTLGRVDSSHDVRFYYRLRDRVALYAERGQLALPATSWRYLADVKHEIRVTRRVFQILAEANFDVGLKAFLGAYCVLILGFNCGGRRLVIKAKTILGRRSRGIGRESTD